MIAYLWLLSVLVPGVWVWGAGSLFWIATDRAFVIPQSADVWIVQSVIAGAPFLALALAATIRRKRASTPHDRRFFFAASIAGLATTSALWAHKYHVGYVYWAEKDTSGADIGLGMLMCASPVVVGTAMLLAGFGWRALRAATAATSPGASE